MEANGFLIKAWFFITVLSLGVLALAGVTESVFSLSFVSDATDREDQFLSFFKIAISFFVFLYTLVHLVGIGHSDKMIAIEPSSTSQVFKITIAILLCHFFCHIIKQHFADIFGSKQQGIVGKSMV